MQRKFITNLILLLALNLLIKPFWILGIDRAVQNTVGLESYGLYFTLFNFSFIFNILLDLGITNFNNRNIAQNQHLLNKHFSGIIVVRLLLAAVYLIVTFAVALIIGYSMDQLYLLWWIALSQILLSTVLYLRSNISGLLLLRTDSLVSVLDRLLMIIFCAVLLWGNVTQAAFRIEWFVYAQTAAYFLTALIAFFIVVVKARFRRIYWNWPFFVMIVRRSLPYALLVFMMAIYNRLDPVFLERLLPEPQGEIQSGIYAQAYRLFDAANQVAFLFAGLLLPIFANMIKNNKDVVGMVRLSFGILFTISVTFAVGSMYYSGELMALLYPHDNLDASGIFSVLVFGFIAVSSIYVFGTLLTANGSLRELNTIAAIAIVLNLVINLSLIPRLQAMGSAYASLSAQMSSAILQVIVVQRLFRFRVNIPYLLSIFFFVAGVFAIGYISTRLAYPWHINLGIFLLLAFILSISLRLFSIKGLLRILKERDADSPE